MFTASQHQKPRFLPYAIAIFVLLTCLRVWVGPVPLLPKAQAQIPDSGMQRKLLLDEAKRTNQLLGEIKQILTSHTLNVRLEGADNQARPPGKQRRDGTDSSRP
jgi:hypothetical protein